MSKGSRWVVHSVRDGLSIRYVDLNLFYSGSLGHPGAIPHRPFTKWHRMNERLVPLCEIVFRFPMEITSTAVSLLDVTVLMAFK